MADNIKSNKPQTSCKANRATYQSLLNEITLQRSYLNETIANIYMLKGKVNPKLKKSFDEVLEQAENRNLGKARRHRLGHVRNQRKQKRPRKLNNNRCNINFKLYFRNKTKLTKMRRGYLNDAAKKIKHEIEVERLLRRYNDGDFVICKAFKRFYENADDLMKQVRNLRYRARCALTEYSY